MQRDASDCAKLLRVTTLQKPESFFCFTIVCFTAAVLPIDRLEHFE